MPCCSDCGEKFAKSASLARHRSMLIAGRCRASCNNDQANPAKRRRIDAVFAAEAAAAPQIDAEQNTDEPLSPGPWAGQFVTPHRTTQLQRRNPPHPTEQQPLQWNLVAELAALAAEELTQAGADRLFKALSHPESDLQEVQQVLSNKRKWLDYLDSAAKISVSSLDIPQLSAGGGLQLTLSCAAFASET